MDEARRHILRLGVLTAASTVFPLGALGAKSSKPPAASAPEASVYDALATLMAADFKPFVGATFKIQSGASSVRVILVEVQNPPALAKTATTPAANDQTFALRFKSISGPALTQGTYVFQNSALGSFAMFVVPSSAKASPMYYTGQVNRSIQ